MISGESKAKFFFWCFLFVCFYWRKVVWILRYLNTRGRVKMQKECDLAGKKDREEMNPGPRAGLADLIRRGHLVGFLNL